MSAVRRRGVALLTALALVLGQGIPGVGNGPTAVSAADANYSLCGRVFPDPHAFWPAPVQAPARSPFAKGNAPALRWTS